MKFSRIADMAKRQIDKRGGMDALKGDLQEVQEIAKGRGSLREKAKAAAAAVRTPRRRAPASGAPRPADPAAGHDDPTPPRAA